MLLKTKFYVFLRRPLLILIFNASSAQVRETKPRVFIKSYTDQFFLKYFQKIQVSLKSDKNNGYFT